MSLERSKGTRDFLPQEQIARNEIIKILTRLFEQYGFAPLETPITERWDVLASKYAGGAEILKETFRFKDQGDRELGLRYDLTVPLARVVAMNPQLKMPFKRYQIGPVFRDGPVGFGRYREFIQCDVDIVGCSKLTADAELIALADAAFRELGLQAVIRINNRKLLNEVLTSFGVPATKMEQTILSIDKLEKLGWEAVQKELKLGGGTVKKIGEFLAMQKSPKKDKIETIQAMVPGSEGLQEIREVFSILDGQKIEVDFDISLARGISYYTGTIIEVVLKNSDITSSVCGGGRYDSMIGSFMGKGAVPAVGISFGLDRIYDSTEKKEKKSVADVYIIPIGTFGQALSVCQELRKKGINADIDLSGRGPSKNLNYASSLGIPYAIFFGEEEARKNKVKLRDMTTGKEVAVSLNEAIQTLGKQLHK